MKRPLAILSAAALLSLSPAPIRAQIVTDMGRSGGGVITTTTEGALTGEEYAAQGIIAQWEETLREFESYEGDTQIDVQVQQAQQSGAGMDEESGGPWKYLTTPDGRRLRVPVILDEDGVDLFLLTEDGISLYMAVDAPAYFQETNPDIVKWVRYYAVKKKSYTKIMFKRYKDWEKTIKDCFARYGVPTEIAELCLIESGCTYSAKSHVGALGMWQIMPETGRGYGMVVNQFRDDRLDPHLSLPVAARILRDCYSKIGDWTLSVAAYNCGSGNVLRQSKKVGKDWPLVQPLLPKETQQYIPGLLAIHYVWTYRKELGLEI